MVVRMTKKKKHKRITSSSVLLVNSHNLPLNVMPKSKALHMWVKGKADIVESHNDKFFYVWGDKFELPTVMRMRYFVNITKKRQLKDYYNRLNVWKRDEGICQYCGKRVKSQNFTVDHVTPRKLGGQTNWKNIVTCCWPCNSKKDCLTVEQAGMKLMKIPAPPDVDETIESTILERFKRMNKIPIKAWEKYI